MVQEHDADATMGWDKEAQCWRVLLGGVPQPDPDGSLEWSRFNDAFDAMQNYRRSGRSSL
ncbi:hypothetical protein GXW82_28910 [Streptacidiphilus sp. 4-A2]|nr:hypothetical protein [Streptacidiphilus sp. 4-A2]